MLTNHKEKVQWLLDFAYRDFDAMREGDIVNLREDLVAVLRNSTNEPVTVIGSDESKEYIVGADADWFRGLQIQLRDLLHDRYHELPMRREVTVTENMVLTTLTAETVSEPAELRFRIRTDGYKGWTVLNLVSDDGEQSAESEILFIAQLALGMTDTSNVLVCPSCNERVFWRVRRQRFCSAACRQKESYQAWLERGGIRGTSKATKARAKK